MRFLANEDFPLRSLQRPREAGHDVEAIVEDSPGAKDWEVLARAASEHRIVLTSDRDYGELIYRRRLPVARGVVCFRFVPRTPEEPAEHLLRFVTIDSPELAEKFTVVARDRVRQRSLS